MIGMEKISAFRKQLRAYVGMIRGGVGQLVEKR